jgi:flavin reductase (DIM6/NTAB) family NADH-FMN oxidoreductase RutF
MERARFLAARRWSAAIFVLCCSQSAAGAAEHSKGERMHFDVAAIPANEAYKLLVSTIVPRPIALATTVGRNGRINAAPFSFFNAVSSVPPVVVLGISPGDPDAPPNDGYKDTERNIRDTGEFVVNLVDEAIAERMNVCAVDFPNTVGELEHADLHPIPSVGVRPPRIAESPVSFECKRITGLSLGPRSTLEVGRVIHIHIRDDLVDPTRYYVATEKMRLIGRMHGRGWYARTTDLFLMDRISFADWKDGKQ